MGERGEMEVKGEMGSMGGKMERGELEEMGGMVELEELVALPMDSITLAKAPSL